MIAVRRIGGLLAVCLLLDDSELRALGFMVEGVTQFPVSQRDQLAAG